MSAIGRRRSIEITGFAHANPVPAASRIGPFVFSGVLTGRDAAGTMPPDLAGQVANIFAHAREVVEAAGGTTDDIVKMTVWVRPELYRDREALNAAWLAEFPDAASRPTRQVMATVLDGETLVQADLVAIVGG